MYHITSLFIGLIIERLLVSGQFHCLWPDFCSLCVSCDRRLHSFKRSTLDSAVYLCTVKTKAIYRHPIHVYIATEPPF